MFLFSSAKKTVITCTGVGIDKASCINVLETEDLSALHAPGDFRLAALRTTLIRLPYGGIPIFG